MRQHRRISVATTLPAEPEGSRHVFQIEKGPFPGPGPVIRVETGDRTR
jgi:hypothetical protein